jgi:hypothetical protein
MTGSDVQRSFWTYVTMTVVAFRDDAAVQAWGVDRLHQPARRRHGRPLGALWKPLAIDLLPSGVCRVSQTE